MCNVHSDSCVPVSNIARKPSVSLEPHAIAPHAANVEQLPDILQRIALHKQQVSLPTCLNDTSVSPAKAASSRRGRCSKCFYGRQSGCVHEMVELEVQRRAEDGGQTGTRVGAAAIVMSQVFFRQATPGRLTRGYQRPEPLAGAHSRPRSPIWRLLPSSPT